MKGFHFMNEYTDSLMVSVSSLTTLCEKTKKYCNPNLRFCTDTLIICMGRTAQRLERLETMSLLNGICYNKNYIPAWKKHLPIWGTLHHYCWPFMLYCTARHCNHLETISQYIFILCFSVFLHTGSDVITQNFQSIPELSTFIFQHPHTIHSSKSFDLSTSLSKLYLKHFQIDTVWIRFFNNTKGLAKK